MIIDIIVILKLYLIFLSNRKWGCPTDTVLFGTHVRIRIPRIIIRTPYILLNKLRLYEVLIYTYY